MDKAILVLEDGTAFEGESCGVPGEEAGKVVFQTDVVGYQEILTTPSYRGHLVALTYPLIGNYGVNSRDWESETVHPRGLILKEMSPIYNNFRAEKSLPEFLRENGLMAIERIDTRALAIHLRDHGEMMGILSTKESEAGRLHRKLKETSSAAEEDWLSQVTPKEAILPRQKRWPSIAVMDFGMRRSLIEQFEALGCSLTRYPAYTPAAKVLDARPDGILLSPGPGNPGQTPSILEEVGKLVAGGIPVLGIGLGHQFLGMALGAGSKRMHLGHHSGNQPVREVGQSRSLITSQSHSFVLEVPEEAECLTTHSNLNDGSVEGVRSKKDPRVFSVQFMPRQDENGRPDPVLQRFLGSLSRP